MDDEHDGTLETADTGWFYVQCSCGWYSARSLNIPDYSWAMHESHQRNEAQMREIRREIHGK